MTSWPCQRKTAAEAEYSFATRSRVMDAPPCRGLQIHHHVIALHRHCERLGDIRPLHHARTRFDIDRIGAGAKALGVAVGLSGADIEFPAVPGAADDLAQLGVFDLAG